MNARLTKRGTTRPRTCGVSWGWSQTLARCSGPGATRYCTNTSAGLAAGNSPFIQQYI